MPKSAQDRPRPETINTLVAGVYPALAMLAGMQLELFTPLGDGAQSVDELAAALDIDATRLRPLLYALVSAGLLEVAGEKFANTAEADTFLVKGRRGYLGGQHEVYADLWQSTLLTADSIRSGQPQAKHDFGAMGKAELAAFMRGLDAGAGAAARRLMKSHDLGRFRNLLDAGGGGGGLAATLCAANPELAGTVVELPLVAEVAAEMIAERGLTERVSSVGCDVVSEPPPGRYDLAVLRAFLQVLGPNAAARALANVAQSIEPGGEIFIIGRVLDDDRLGPLDAVAANVMFLNIYDQGQAYTEAEHRDWLAAAGFNDIEREVLGGGYSIIRGVRR
ncbi:MAG: methyltransferase [Alphaproteobacteria bacterium]|jgi:hypothetical protein|nr:methyltransferase [Alphaproteobacteria bacterium]MDP6563363.1 methyltransferase [Alphaproteobacteria bacterium]MDP6812155.1 methyltransferase [Alphaproteobacteria bacterium]